MIPFLTHNFLTLPHRMCCPPLLCTPVAKSKSGTGQHTSQDQATFRIPSCCCRCAQVTGPSNNLTHHILWCCCPVLRRSEGLYGKILGPYLDDPSNLFIISSDFCHWGSRFSYSPFTSPQEVSHAHTAARCFDVVW